MAEGEGREEDGPGSDFAALGLLPSLVAAVNGLGYEEPTPIQREAIPVVLSGSLLGTRRPSRVSRAR